MYFGLHNLNNDINSKKLKDYETSVCVLGFFMLVATWAVHYA